MAFGTTTGFYKVSASGYCELSFGYIPTNYLQELRVAPYYSSKYVKLASSTSYSGQVLVKGDVVFVAFNNNSMVCVGFISSEKQEYNVARLEASVSIPYSGGASFNHAGLEVFGGTPLNSFRITSQSNNPMIVGASVDSGNSFQQIALKANESTLVAGHEMILRCEYQGGCPVKVAYLFVSSGNTLDVVNGIVFICVLVFISFFM